MIDGCAYTDAAERQPGVLSIPRPPRPFDAVGSSKVPLGRDDNGCYAIVDGVPAPACLDLTFVRIEDRALAPSRDMVSMALDMSCRPGRADYQLGRFEY